MNIIMNGSDKKDEDEKGYIVDIPIHKILIEKVKDLYYFLINTISEIYPFLKRNLYSSIIKKRKDKKSIEKTKEIIQEINSVIIEKGKKGKEQRLKNSNDLNSLYDTAKKIDEESPFAEFDKEDYLEDKN